MATKVPVHHEKENGEVVAPVHLPDRMAGAEAKAQAKLHGKAKKAGAKKGEAGVTVTIQPANFKTAMFLIVGVAPYVQNKFSAKARQKMRETQEAGSTAKKGTKREPKDFQGSYEGAIHRFPDGGHGIPAPAFRNACIDACRMCGFAMTQAKMSIFVEADGFDPDDGTPLVRITKGEPGYFESTVRNDSGVCDIRARPMWQPGWEATLRVRFDADQFTMDDVANLLNRAGQQVGVGEGRPFSKKSAGLGWGLFVTKNEDEAQ
jgi:hypothetical protein